MRKKTNQAVVTVEVATSALNEEANILRFLESVLSQREEGFTLKRILVISDGSRDRTAHAARSMRSSKIEVREHVARAGKSARLNEIYTSLEADILVQLDADVVLAHEYVIRDLIQPMIREQNILMCGGNSKPMQPVTFTEKAVYCTTEAYALFRTRIRGGHNSFSADGRILAFRKELAKQLHVPHDMIANDMFTYLSCVSMGYGYRHAPSAIAYFRLPQSLRDQIRQNIRFAAAPSRMERYFDPALVRRERHVPLNIWLRSIMWQVFRHPIRSSYIFLVNSYCRIRASFVEKSLNAKWEIVRSTKMLRRN